MTEFSQGQAIPVYKAGIQDKLNSDGLKSLLTHLEENGGFDDLYISAGYPVTVKSGGRIQTVIPRRLDDNESQDIINAIYDENATNEVYRGQEIDTSYTFRVSRSKRYRYRVNALTRRSATSKIAINIVMRSIKSTPVPIDQLDVEQELVEAMFPKQGMVVVAGETGSGKSTLLSSAIRHYVETGNHHSVILTYEWPIEYVYDEIEKQNCIILQTEVGTNVESFSAGIRNALRCSPEIILVGEMRDAETIESGIRASMTGHLLLTTAHANSVVETVRRMANECGQQRDVRIKEIIANARLFIVQYLAAKIGGGRTPIREYFLFDQETRSELLSLPTEDMLARLEEMVNERGNTMLRNAKEKLEAGLINQETYQFIEAGV